jgi:hypothetical protein
MTGSGFGTVRAVGCPPSLALALLFGVVASCATAGDPRDPKPGDDKSGLFWTNLSATYRGQLTAEGDDEVIQAGLTMAVDVCDRDLLESSKVCSRPEAASDLHEIRCRMQCRAHDAKAGPALVRATLFVGGRSVALQLDRLP